MSTHPASTAPEIRTTSGGQGQGATAATASAAAAATHARPILGSVTSRDGTTIGYRQLGRGPGVILLHGSASSGADHVELARLLSDAFTVIVPDRRGHRLSGPYRTGDELQQELDDVAALLDTTGAQNVWG